MSWVSPDWLSTSWVSSSYLSGDSPSPPDGNWIGYNWLRPGWLLSDWVTNDGDAPTSVFVGDTLNVSVSESRAVLVKSTRTDTLSVSLAETFNLLYKRHVVASDSLTITLGEQQLSRKTTTVSDTLAVAVGETASRNSGAFTQISVSDTLDIEIDDPGINQFIEVLDDINISLSETLSVPVRLLRSDSLDISLGESANRLFTGLFQVQVSDTLNLDVSEITQLSTFRTIAVADSLNISLVEIGSRLDGVTVSYLQVFDNVDLGVGESQSLFQLGVTAKSVADSINVAVDDQSSKVELFFFSVGDTLAIAVGEAVDIGKTSVDITWENADWPWGGTTLRDLKPLPIMVKGTDFLQADQGSTFNGEPITSVLERLGLTVFGRDRQGNWKEDPDLIKMVTGVYPIFRGQPGTVVRIYVGAQDDPEGAVEWEGPFEFVFGQDKFVDPIISGRYIAVRFESVGQPPWQLLSYDLDIKVVGRGV